MPKKLRPKSRRQRRAIAPLTQVRRAACSHPCEQSKRHQGRRRHCGHHRRRHHRHQSTVRRAANQLKAADASSPLFRVYKNSEELRSRIVSGIITPIHEQWEKANLSPHREFPPATAREVDPLQIHPQHPHTSRQPTWWVHSPQRAAPASLDGFCPWLSCLTPLWTPHISSTELSRVLVFRDRKWRSEWSSEFLYCC